MKPIDELLIAWRDESITAAELKELEQLLAEPGARERLFEEFLVTATIAEALKVATASPQVRPDPQHREPAKRSASRFVLWAAAAVLLLIAGATYLSLTSRTPRDSKTVAKPAPVDQKKDGPITEKPVVEDEHRALPAALRGFNGTMNGQVVKVNKDSIVLKMTDTRLRLINKEVAVIVKDVKNLPPLTAGDQIYATVTEVDGQLIAKTLFKVKTTNKRALEDEF